MSRECKLFYLLQYLVWEVDLFAYFTVLCQEELPVYNISFIVNKNVSHDYKIWFQLDKDICHVQGMPLQDWLCKKFITASCTITGVILSKLRHQYLLLYYSYLCSFIWYCYMIRKGSNVPWVFNYIQELLQVVSVFFLQEMKMNILHLLRCQIWHKKSKMFVTVGIW